MSEPVNGAHPDRAVRCQGRSTNQLLFLELNVMKTLWKHQFSFLFREPMDATISDMPKNIEKPMDLGTIKNRLEYKYYHSAQECIEDFKTMFSNCYRYCSSRKDIVAMAMAQFLEKMFLDRVAKMDKEEKEIIPNERAGKKRGRARRKASVGSSGNTASLTGPPHKVLDTEEVNLTVYSEVPREEFNEMLRQQR